MKTAQIGVPIHKGKKKKSDWKELVEKIKNKIQSLGTIWLNPTGKLILLNAVLTAFPIFIWSITLAHKLIVLEIEKEMKHFLWEGGKHNGNKKLHLVNWETVCKQKDRGGVEIKDLAAMNLALGAKIIWNLISGCRAWWKEALRKKYLIGTRDRCLDVIPTHQNGSSI